MPKTSPLFRAARKLRRPALVVGVVAMISVPIGTALLSSPAGAASIAVSNPSLESATSSVPTCWQTNSWGTNSAKYSRVSPGHTGNYAETVTISSYSSGARRLVLAMGTAGCTPTVTGGHQYQISNWYKASGTARWVVWYLSKSSGSWVYWTGGPTVSDTSSWQQSSFTTPAAPSDAARLSFGLSLESVGSTTVDDFTLADVTASPPPPTSSSASPSPTTSSTTTSSSPSPSPSTSSTSPSPSPTTTSTSPGGGATWYVSRNGDGSSGTSWATAWSELSKINWSVVQPGDQILIDGGSTTCASNYDFANHTTARPGLNCGMLYQTAMTVGASGTAAAPITVRLAPDAGHNGTAVFFGGRSSMLPYCDQSSYTATGTANAAGVTIPGRTHVVIDGTHRSGIMIYGAQSGVDLASDSTGFITLRDLEIFDNGTYGTWSYGYRSDGEGISLAGHDITVDGSLIHDNGQDEIQDRYTGTINNNSHAALYNITVKDSWLYVHRDHPQFTGYGFNAGSQGVASQDCTHVDGIQIWGGGLHQKNLVIDHDVFGPLIAQGVYPGDQNAASFDQVTVTNSLFVNVLDHSIIGDSISSDSSTPGQWLIANDTAYQTTSPNTGLSSHGQVDLAGSGHTIRNSIFVDGYFWTATAPAASGNVWWGGDPVPGGTQQNPAFASAMPSTNSPVYSQLYGLNFTPSCSACSSAGSPMHSISDLLAAIDAGN